MAPFFSLKKDKIFLKKDFSLFLCWARILIMNTENTLKIGDVVKSLDFVGNNNCYYVGKVLSVDENSGTFTAEVWDRIWQGESIDRVFAKTFTAPLPGNHLLDDLEENIRDPRIQVVGCLMNISEAVEIIEQQAKRDGVGVLELLETLDRYGALWYIQEAKLGIEFLTAFNIFMDSGRKMFAKAEAALQQDYA